MEMVITDNALKWFKDDIGAQAGDKVRFYAQLYGTSPVQPGYSLAFSKGEEPVKMAVSVERDGILFFVEDTDEWYFAGHNLYVDYDPKEDELKYTYVLP
mgnify:CR=1 FL=1